MQEKWCDNFGETEEVLQCTVQHKCKYFLCLPFLFLYPVITIRSSKYVNAP